MASKDLDRLFSDKLVNFDMEPSSQAMGSMHQYFRVRSRKKAFKYISIAASISFLMFLTGRLAYFHIQSNNSNQGNLVEEARESGLNNSGLNQNTENNLLTPLDEDRNQKIRTGESIITPKQPIRSSEKQEMTEDVDPGQLMVSNSDLLKIPEPGGDVKNNNRNMDLDSASQLYAKQDQDSDIQEMAKKVVKENYPIVIIYKPGKKVSKPDSAILASGKESKRSSLKNMSEFARNVRDKSPTLGDIRSAKDELMAFDFLRKNKSKIQNDENDK